MERTGVFNEYPRRFRVLDRSSPTIWGWWLGGLGGGAVVAGRAPPHCLRILSRLVATAMILGRSKICLCPSPNLRRLVGRDAPHAHHAPGPPRAADQPAAAVDRLRAPAGAAAPT